MEVFKWYRSEYHKNMSNSFNCIYLSEEPKGDTLVNSYHLMIKNGEITQIMNGQTHAFDDMKDMWFPLEDENLIEKADKWRNFIEAKNMLLEVSKRFIMSIENNKLKKIWG
ncbi:MAG: hypothetical protein ACOCQD_04280 [archaeon]